MPGLSLIKKPTSAAESAMYYRDHPDELPASAPDPREDAQGFAEWYGRRENKSIKLKLVTEWTAKSET